MLICTGQCNERLVWIYILLKLKACNHFIKNTAKYVSDGPGGGTITNFQIFQGIRKRLDFFN